MTHLDNLVADSLAQSPDTVVRQLATDRERLRGELEAARAEIADLKRGGVVVPELTACGCQYYAGDAEAGTAYREKCTKRHPCLRCVQRHNAELASRLRPIPADRELMRLVDELIRWHGLRPLDKRPDHAAALVGAIKALRAQATQELAP